MKRIAVLVVSYNAAELLVKTLDRIPADAWEQVEEVVIFDDCSPDHTYVAALEYKRLRGIQKMRVIRHRRNRGYGGNQKRGYQYCLKRGFDAVVLLHGDGQYAPELLPQIVGPVLRGEADMVFGSRMAPGCDPRAGGMPLYKYYGNRILSWMQRRLTGLNITEYHSGYRAYSCAALRRLPLVRNTDTWHFDTQILLELYGHGFRIGEVPIPTFYGDEVSHVNGYLYAMHCLWECIKYRWARSGFWRTELYDTTPPDYEMHDHLGSSHRTILNLVPQDESLRILDVGVAAGYLDRELSNRGHHVTGIEQDVERAERARGSCQELLVGDVEALDLSGYSANFDCLILGDVLEHLKDPARALDRLTQTVRPGGRVIACVPNVANLYVRLKLLLGRFDYEPRGIMDDTHLRFFTLHSARSLIQDAGLEVLSVRPTPLPLPLLFPRAARRWWFRAGYRVLYGFTRLFRGLLAYQFVIEAEKSAWLESMHHPEVAEAAVPAMAGKR